MKNIDIENGVYIVRTPDGKTKTYKTLRGAERYAARMSVALKVPEIITANTYSWPPAVNAYLRRQNEDHRNFEISRFAAIFTKIATIEVSGEYRESCKNVYKSMHYSVNGEPTNLTGLIGEAARWGIKLQK